MAFLDYEKQSVYQAAEEEFRKAEKFEQYESRLQRYQAAVQKYQSIADWQDAKEKAALCWAKIKELKAKKDTEDEASRLAAEKKAKLLKKWKKLGLRLAIAAVPVAVLIAGLVHALNHKIIPASRYEKAVSFMENGQYDKAIPLFRLLGSYKDSADMIELSYAQKYGTEAWSEIQSVCPGDIITFGNYYGELSWRVLDNDHGELLLLSEKAIAAAPYNETFEFTSWEKCSLRRFLNGEFYEQAFSDEEKAEIELCHLSQPDNEPFFSDGGNDTDDYIFLLSHKDISLYFSDSRYDLMCEGTDHALETGLVVGINKCCWWWLRTPGHSLQDGAIISHVGNLSLDGNFVNNDEGGVRPAIRVNFWD